MSKVPSLDSAVIVRKGHAAPAASAGAIVDPRDQLAPPQNSPIQATQDPENQGSKESRSQEAKNTPRRRRAWDGQDEWIKVNFEIPKRVRTKLKELKNWERIPSLKDFVALALEAAVDKEIAKAEKDGL